MRLSRDKGEKRSAPHYCELVRRGQVLRVAELAPGTIDSHSSRRLARSIYLEG